VEFLMIGRLTGLLIEKQPPGLCLDVNGVGYDIDVPMSTFYDLPEAGAKVTLFTHLAIRDDAHVLYGFLRQDERATFRALIKVTGIGARTALAVLSGMSSADLSAAIAQQDTALLTRIPGIGKKTAERLLLELRGKLDAIAPATPAATGQNDVLNALLALGYSDREARATVKSLPAGLDVSEGIRAALKVLSS